MSYKVSNDLSKKKGLFSEAIADYNNAVQMKPDHVAWYQRYSYEFIHYLFL